MILVAILARQHSVYKTRFLKKTSEIEHFFSKYLYIFKFIFVFLAQESAKN
jgi:hypothetical protein